MRRHGTVLVALLISVASAGAADANLLTNAGAETGDLTAWVDALGNGFSVADSMVLVPHPSPEGTHAFWGGVSGPAAGGWTNEIRQDVDVSSMSVSIDASNATADFTGWGYSGSDGGYDDTARIIVEFLDETSGLLEAYDSIYIGPVNTWVQVMDSRTVPIGTRTIRVRLRAERAIGASTDAFFDGLSLTVSSTLPVNPASWGYVKNLYERDR